MKAIKPLVLALLLTSCTTTITSPVTGIHYIGRISDQGISVSALPPFWAWAVNWYKSFK